MAEEDPLQGKGKDWNDEPFGEPKPPSRGLWTAVIVLLCATGISVAVAVKEHGRQGTLASRNAELSSSLGQTRSQLSVLASKINSLESAQAAATQRETEKKAVAHATRRAAVRRRRVRRPSLEQRRLAELQKEMNDNKQAISSTQQNLEQTRQALQANLDNAQSKLGGQIATTHDELVALEKKGERNYYEFQLNKLKRFSREGPVGIKLRKANVKHQFCDLELMVDDRDLTKKHVDLYEPVVFYPEGSHRPVQIVIIGISKNHMHGYVSEPKYPEVQASASPAPAAPAIAASTRAAALISRPRQ